MWTLATKRWWTSPHFDATCLSLSRSYEMQTRWWIVSHTRCLLVAPAFRSGTPEQTQRCRKKGVGHGWVEWNTGRISRPSHLFGAERAGPVPQVRGSSTDSWPQTKWQRSWRERTTIARWDFKEMLTRVVNKRRWAFLVLASQKPLVDFLVSRCYPSWHFPWFLFLPWQ